MPPRKKSKFEQWFSFSRHQRRFGADKIYESLEQTDIETLKKKLIVGNDIEYTYGSEKDLNKHIENLKREFVGQPEINHFHASLIVLIRREIDIDKNYNKFKDLWLSERDFLLNSLNMRWLVSACDTFIDYEKDTTLRAILMIAVVLINTIKAQETEAILSVSEKPVMKLMGDIVDRVLKQMTSSVMYEIVNQTIKYKIEVPLSFMD